MRVGGNRIAVFVCAFVFALLGVVHDGQAAEAAPNAAKPEAVPDPLKPWVGWVLNGKEQALCPLVHGSTEARRCLWSGRLALEVDEKGATFSQSFALDAKGFAPLPGNGVRFPLDTKVDGKAASVVLRGDVPVVQVEPGEHVVSGRFLWDSAPEELAVPLETGLLSLVLRGQAVPVPRRDEKGTLYLARQSTNEEGERLEIVVHRMLSDDVPAVLTTRIELNVSGKGREVLLGRALPDGFTPLSLETPLPVRVEPDGHLRAQLRPGSYSIVLTARSQGPVQAIKRPAPDGPWREGEEVWVFEARPNLRVVTVEGANAIDPQQTSLPAAWKRLPAYPMKVGDTLRLVESRRGDADPAPDSLTLTRRLWLDFDGTGYTATDVIDGNLSRASRLEAEPPMRLGRASVAGRDQFLTKEPGGKGVGIEVRPGTIHLAADSRIEGDVRSLGAVGWEHDFHKVSATLHLPPGWSLVAASGADDVPESWVRHWSLFELFFAIILALACGRLFGIRWGIVTLVLFALTFPEASAPKWWWLFIVVPEAIHRLVPEGGWKRAFNYMRYASFVVLCVIAIPFAVVHVRQGMFPVLALNESSRDGGDGLPNLLMRKAAESPATEAAPEPAAPPPAQTATVGGVPPDEGAQDADKAKDKEKTIGQLAQNRPDRAGKVDDLLPRSSPSSTSSYDGKKAGDLRQYNAEEYDPRAIVQTGPGLPTWQWNPVHLNFSGPVQHGQSIHLFLLSPLHNVLLAFLRIALLTLVVLRVFPGGFDRLRRFVRGARPPVAAAAAALAIVFALRGTARADVPNDAVLKELGDRLTKTPACAPVCADASRLAITARGRELRLRMSIDALARVAVPIPGGPNAWLPDSVRVDGKLTGHLATDGGKLWIALEPGSHDVILEGPLPESGAVQLPLPLRPHRTEVSAEGWSVAGVHENGIADDVLQISRIEPVKPGEQKLTAGTLPPLVRVDRTIKVGLSWQVETRVVRIGQTGSAIVVRVPLLAGESVTTADVRTSSGAVDLNLPPNAREAAWTSVLVQRSPLALVAPSDPAIVEVWRVDLGPLWHADYKGLPKAHAEPGAAAIPEWHPWPAEKLDVELTKPEGAEGQSFTFDNVHYTVRPGLRATDATLEMTVRASRGIEHVVLLPEGSIVESLKKQGVSQPFRQDGRKVTLTFAPGAESIALQFRLPQAIEAFYRAPSIDLGAPSVNVRVTVVQGDRWLLWLGGPRVGPVVLFWSLLVVLAIVATALSRARRVPLRLVSWLLLLVGLSQIHVVFGAIFVLWLLALAYRESHPEVPGGDAVFNLRQIALVPLTLAALSVLVAAVHQGLLGAPSMQVQGNGAPYEPLTWFTDRSGAVPAMPLVVNVPLFVYRLAMLAWALWVALALLRWLKWGFRAFGTGGLWKKSVPRRVETPYRGPYPYPAGAVPPGYPPQPYAPAPAPAPAPEAAAPPAPEPSPSPPSPKDPNEK